MLGLCSLHVSTLLMALLYYWYNVYLPHINMLFSKDKGKMFSYFSESDYSATCDIKMKQNLKFLTVVGQREGERGLRFLG